MAGQRKSLTGTVVSDKMDKTVVVVVETTTRHRLYHKILKRSRRYLAHDDRFDAKPGDLVRILETRPLSRHKRWRVVEILQRGEVAEIAPQEIDTDRPGAFASPGGGYHTGEDRKDFRHQSAEHFANQIAQFLDSQRLAGEFGKLLLVAPPLFLGVLRKELSSSLSQMVVLELHKEYTHDPLKDLAAHLTEAIKEG